MLKTAHYRLSSVVIGEQCVLADAISTVQENYPARGFPVFEFKPSIDCIVARHEAIGHLQFLHLVTFERGAGAAVIEVIQNAAVDEQPAPDEKEFIQSQLFLLCEGADIIWCSHNNVLRDSSVGHLVNKLIERFFGSQNPPQFQLEAHVDEDQFRNLMRDGIEEIDLAVGGYRETLEYLLQDGRIERAGLLSVLQSIMPQNLTAEDRIAAERISPRLTLRPGRDWDDFHVKEVMVGMAENVLEEMDDGFSIITKNGLRITSSMMRVRQSFNVDGNRRVIDVGQVRAALIQAHNDFRTMGIIEGH